MPLLTNAALLGSLFGESLSLAPRPAHLHPGARLGVEARYNAPERRVGVVQRAHASWWGGDPLEHSGALLTQLGLRPTFGRLGLQAAIGGGLVVSRGSQPRYHLERPFEPRTATDLDAAAVLGVGADVRVAPALAVDTQLEWLAVGPFGLLGAPVLPHTNVHVGLRVTPGGAR